MILETSQSLPYRSADAIAVGLVGGAISELIQQRQTARQQRDLATADQIRDRLAAMGISVVDQPDGEVRWHRQSINQWNG
ncbi:MAG: hypothetical protein F6K00_14480 [Leptolyngbya sp. SIOISBB]|nr:hypothetical protein [Leptolyngbya sp. SIOISBB]